MKKFFPVYVRVPLLFFLFFIGMEWAIDSGDQPAFVRYPIVMLILAFFLLLLIAIEMVVSALNALMRSVMTPEQWEAHEAEEDQWFTETPGFKNFVNKLTRTKKMEEEASITMDHDYDGIKELDNDLPPWWVYLFYGCIAFAIIYLTKYHVLDYDNQHQEFQKEMAEATKAVELYKLTAPDTKSVENVVLLTEPSDLAKGKALFETNCVACHRPDAGGAIGPNLTDAYWILGGDVKEVFNTIMEGGRSGKGMVAWKEIIKPSEIEKIASYVLSLQGSNPVDPKAPEGELKTTPAK